MNIFYKNNPTIINIILIIVIFILISCIIFIKNNNNILYENINYDKKIIQSLYDKNKEILQENKILSIKFSNLNKKIETDKSLIKFLEKNINLNELKLTGDFKLKNREVKNFEGYYDKNCLQPSGIDLCEAVANGKSYNIKTKKCEDVQTGGCSPWLNYGGKSCTESCKWIKSIESLNDSYYLINGSIFFYNIPIYDIDHKSFQILNHGFSKDKNYLYFAGKKQENIKNIDDLKFYQGGSYIYIIEQGLLHIYLMSYSQPEYRYITTYSTIENEIKYLSNKIVLIGNQLFINNKKITLFNNEIYSINKCYIGDKDMILYNRNGDYYIHMNKDYDLQSLKIHSCELIEDKDGFIYKGIRVKNEDSIDINKYKDIKDFQTKLDLNYNSYSNIKEYNFIKISAMKLINEYGEEK